MDIKLKPHRYNKDKNIELVTSFKVVKAEKQVMLSIKYYLMVEAQWRQCLEDLRRYGGG